MKMTMKKNTAVILGMSIGILLVLAFQAQAGEKGERGFDKKKWEEKVNKMYDKLDLSDQQRERLKSHKQKHRQNLKALREKKRAKREELRNEIQKDNFNPGRVKALNNELKSLHNEISDQRLEGVLEVREILTPEQFSRFNQLKEKWHGKRGSKWKNDREHKKEHRKE